MNSTESEILLIHPNPFSTAATILLPSNIDIENSELIVYDIFGKMMRIINDIDDYSIQINKGKLSAGIYIVKLINGNKSIIAKMMVE